MFAGHGALRNWALFHGPQRLSCLSIQHVKKPRLTGLRNHVKRLTLILDSCELGGGTWIVIPKVVMHLLEMPDVLSGSRIECQDSVREQVVAGSVCSVIIVGRRADREVSDASL